MNCLLRRIRAKIPASHSSTMRCIACGARFWAFDADFASLRQFTNIPGSSISGDSLLMNSPDSLDYHPFFGAVMESSFDPVGASR